MAQTYKDTYGHGDSMTESAQWGNSAKRNISKHLTYIYWWNCCLILLQMAPQGGTDTHNNPDQRVAVRRAVKTLFCVEKPF